MNLNRELARLESSGFIRLEKTQPELEYLFRHTLVQEAAYASLLKNEQRELHLRVGEALEQRAADQVERLAPILAFHFSQAGQDERALPYYALAGEAAMRQGALEESLAHFNRGLEIARQIQAPTSRLNQSIGVIYELLGRFDDACQSLGAAYSAAQELGDVQAELQALLRLGAVWAARDYDRTGEYYRQAEQLARAGGDPHSLADSLNRLGNWYANLEQVDNAIPLHHEALSIYRQSGDASGIAATLDLLGMTHALGGQVDKALQFFTQAVDRFRELEDWQGLASTLVSLAMGGAYYESYSVRPIMPSDLDFKHMVEEALEIARRTSWKAGEAYALFVLAQILAEHGDYEAGLETAGQAIRIATAIEHHQWMAAAHFVNGMILLDMFAVEQAEQHLRLAVELAGWTRSPHWMNWTQAGLASNLIQKGQLEQAGQVLAKALRSAHPARTMAQRMLGCAQIELDLARSDWQAALEKINRFADQASDQKVGQSGIRMAYLNATALHLAGRWEEALPSLRFVAEQSERLGFFNILWRCRAALARAYTAQGQTAQADAERQAARLLVEQILEKMHPGPQRDDFAERAEVLVSGATPPSVWVLFG